ncbi:MAG: hypothetical protein AAB372_01280 [Patescibacteria group bacterium]
MSIEENNNKISELKAQYAEVTQRKPSIRKSPLAKTLLISGENTREFEIFRTDMLKELYPQTKVQDLLAEKLIVCGWRLRRATIVEKHLLNRQNAITEEERLESDVWDGNSRKRIHNIKRIDLAQEDARYLAHQQIELQKVMNKTLERLRKEQALRNPQSTSI